MTSTGFAGVYSRSNNTLPLQYFSTVAFANNATRSRATRSTNGSSSGRTRLVLSPINTQRQPNISGTVGLAESLGRGSPHNLPQTTISALKWVSTGWSQGATFCSLDHQSHLPQPLLFDAATCSAYFLEVPTRFRRCYSCLNDHRAAYQFIAASIAFPRPCWPQRLPPMEPYHNQRQQRRTHPPHHLPPEPQPPFIYIYQLHHRG